MGKMVNVVIFVAAIKYSTNNLMVVTKVVDDYGWVEFCFICCSRICLNGCEGRGFPVSVNFAMTSRTVYVLDQNKVELSHKPISGCWGPRF